MSLWDDLKRKKDFQKGLMNDEIVGRGPLNEMYAIVVEKDGDESIPASMIVNGDKSRVIPLVATTPETLKRIKELAKQLLEEQPGLKLKLVKFTEKTVVEVIE